MHVGLFGGSFNPPHLGHLVIAEAIREAFDLEAVWWIPAFRPPHKDDAALASPDHRLAMTRLATSGNPAFTVSDIEVRRGGTSYTVDTLRVLQQAQPDHVFSLIIGGDSLRGFGSWRRPDEILERAALIVYPRPGAAPEVDASLAGRVRLAEAPRLEISSTAIRARVRDGGSIRYLVPDPVRAYIADHGLYRGEG